MRRVPASELERGDWLVCSDGTRARIVTVVRGVKRVVLRFAVQDSRQAHPPFSVPAHTHFVKED